MRRPFITSAFVPLCCAVMSVSHGAELSGDRVSTDNGTLVVHPVQHATFLMQWDGKTIYVDPLGGMKPFADLPRSSIPITTAAATARRQTWRN